MAKLHVLEGRMAFWERFIRETPIAFKDRIVSGEDVFEIATIGRESLEERFAKNDVQEYWSQRYVAENYRVLGFTDAKGPRPPREAGPDFSVEHKGEWVDLEVETTWENYRRHKHHLSTHYRAVRFLVVLAESRPNRSQRKGLPRSIINIDRDHFFVWWVDACRKYAEDAQPNAKLNARAALLSQEMQRFFVSICGDSDRDMATCPDCNSCAYFGEGLFNEASAKFRELAIRFLSERCPPQPHATRGNEIDLCRVDEKELHAFLMRWL